MYGRKCKTLQQCHKYSHYLIFLKGPNKQKGLHYTRLEMLAIDKHSSLFHCFDSIP